MKKLIFVLIVFCALILGGCPSVDETMFPYEVEFSELLCEPHMGWEKTEEYLFFVPRSTYSVYCKDGSVFHLKGNVGTAYDGRYHNVVLISDDEELSEKVKNIAQKGK